MALTDDRQIVDKRCHALKKTVLLRVEFLVGASGAVTSQSPYGEGGILVTEVDTETGRYTLAIDRRYGKIHRKGASMIIGDDAAATAAAGNGFLWRDDDIGSNGAQDGTIELQCVRTDTSADADPTSGSKIEAWLEVETV